MLEKLNFKLPQQPFTNEKSFTARLWREIHSKRWFWHKISDQSQNYKPCDSIFWIDWFCWLVEIKYWKETRNVNVSKKLRRNQQFALERYQKNGWQSIVIYYSQPLHKYRIMEYSKDMKLNLK